MSTPKTRKPRRVRVLPNSRVTSVEDIKICNLYICSLRSDAGTEILKAAAVVQKVCNLVRTQAALAATDPPFFVPPNWIQNQRSRCKYNVQPFLSVLFVTPSHPALFSIALEFALSVSPTTSVNKNAQTQL